MFGIKESIYEYYKNMLNLNLQELKIFSKKDRTTILECFNPDIKIKLNEYDTNLKQTIENCLKDTDQETISLKINLLLSGSVFSFIKKDKYIYPFNIPKSEDYVSLLKKFFRLYLYSCIIQTLLECLEYVDFFEKEFEPTFEKGNINQSHFLYEMCETIKNKISDRCYKGFSSFYIYLINKYDKNTSYIFPMIQKPYHGLLISSIVDDFTSDFKSINDSNDNTSTEINLLSDPNIETPIIQKNVYKLGESKGGAAQHNPDKNLYMKNVYPKGEIVRIENILNEANLNKLIENKQIKLSSRFHDVLLSLHNTKDVDTPTKKKIFDELFLIEPDNDYKTYDVLYYIYINEPDKNLFLDYLIDKVSYYNFLESEKEISISSTQQDLKSKDTNPSSFTNTSLSHVEKFDSFNNELNITNNSSLPLLNKSLNLKTLSNDKLIPGIMNGVDISQRGDPRNKEPNTNSSSGLLSMIDKVFDYIFKQDFRNNSMQLGDEDVKFILALETLETIKNSLHPPVSQPEGKSQVIVNLFKDVDETTINDNYIKFN